VCELRVRGTTASFDEFGATTVQRTPTSPRLRGEHRRPNGRRSWRQGRRCEASAMRRAASSPRWRAGEGGSPPPSSLRVPLTRLAARAARRPLPASGERWSQPHVRWTNFIGMRSSASEKKRPSWNGLSQIRMLDHSGTANEWRPSSSTAARHCRLANKFDVKISAGSGNRCENYFMPSEQVIIVIAERNGAIAIDRYVRQRES
jgi:hypothetical protein